jgi:FkbM family methyltransferase
MTSLKHRVAEVLSPLARTYVRYGASLPGRETLFRRLSWVPLSGHTSTQHGFRMAFDSRDLIRRNIHWFGVWEPTLSMFVTSRLKPGDCFVDVGCNVGYFSLLAASRIGPSGKVVAIDASASMGDMLAANQALNRLDNIHFVHGAVSDSVGTLTLYPGPESNTGQASVVLNVTRSEGTTVNAAPISHWVPPEVWQRARIIKVDIEGAEGHFIAGLGDSLTTLRPDCELLMELAPDALAAAGRSIEGLLETMCLGGFHPYRIENEYDYAFYAKRRHSPQLQRLRNAPKDVMDVVFSRVDADTLALDAG